MTHVHDIRCQNRTVYTVAICSLCHADPHSNPMHTHVTAQDWPRGLDSKEMQTFFRLAPDLTVKLLRANVVPHIKSETKNPEDAHLTVNDWPRGLTVKETLILIRLAPKLVAKMARANAIPT